MDMVVFHRFPDLGMVVVCTVDMAVSDVLMTGAEKIFFRIHFLLLLVEARGSQGMCVSTNTPLI